MKLPIGTFTQHAHVLHETEISFNQLSFLLTITVKCLFHFSEDQYASKSCQQNPVCIRIY